MFRLICLAACVIGAMTVAGCSAPPSSTATSPSTPTTSHGPLLAGTVDVQGDFAISSSFETHAEVQSGALPTAAPATETCATYAAGSAATFVAPELSVTTDHKLYFRDSVLAGYTGPGTYESKSNPRLLGVAAVTVLDSNGGAVSVYDSKNGGSTSLTVRADGSGTITFSHWGSDEHRSVETAGYLYGTVTWRCQQPS